MHYLINNVLIALALLAPALSVSASHPKEVVAILGDSNTWTGGDDCSGQNAWTKQWVEAYKPASARSYARSGATWTNTATTKRNITQDISVLGPDNTIYNQVERLAAAIADGSQKPPTLIIIMAGTNDAWFHKRRPGAFETSAAEALASPSDDELLLRAPSGVRSLAGAIRQNCLRLKMIAPEAQIVLVGPLQSVQAPDNMIIAAGGIIEEMGRGMGIPTIRLDRDFPLSSAEEEKRHRLTRDGTHTSPEGATLLGDFLAKTISSLNN
ncbi:MAG: GDSL-type esterase/lipase family protein [Pseudoflavonifractor sp.]|nr:GDSL-type esterase/lipase family protein [Alloprevotella sp.]MCM1117513.1 GDSL-type esterase/lipase family protein [Pseudoflavonifractor sp.]